MTTDRFLIELRWSRKVALSLAIALAVPLLAITGLLIALAAHPGAAPAGVALSAPTTLAYQGQVKVNGQPFAGAGQFKFAIVSANGLAAFWSNDGSNLGAAPFFTPTSSVNLTVTAGLFNVLLGDTTLPHMTQPITSGIFLNPGRALRVWFSDGVNGFQQLAPDVTLAAVPYALNAQTLDGLDSSAFAPLAHNHSAADIVAGTLNDARLSANVVLSGQAVSRLINDPGYLTQTLADARYAGIHPTPKQIALLKWYSAISTTQSNFVVGSGPSQLAFDGENMWITSYFGNSVSVLRTTDGFHVMTPTVGNHPAGIAFDGANMWVVNNDYGAGNMVSVLRASDGTGVFISTVGLSPRSIAFDGTDMWVTNSTDNSVSVLRASDGSHVMTLTVGASPAGMAFDGTNMWVANTGGNTVSVLRVSDGSHVFTPTVGVEPTNIAFDGTNMWVTNPNTSSGNTVSILRASDGYHVYTPTVGMSPQGIAFDGAFMWVANGGSGTVSKR